MDMDKSVVIPKRTLTLFDSWTRNATNTEYLAEWIRSAGIIHLSAPCEHSTIYRVQPKITWGERRRALCYLDRHYGCEDIAGYWGHTPVIFSGIDLLSTIGELCNAESITVEYKSDDVYLWVYVTNEPTTPTEKVKNN